MESKAINTILDEHRLLASVLHALRHLVREMRDRQKAPDFRLLGAILYYLDAFSERLHNPKEAKHIFGRLRSRTHEADTLLDVLDRQHAESSRLGQELDRALVMFESGVPEGLARFSTAVDHLLEEANGHMALEEKELLPLARKHLLPQDWAAISAAFEENGGFGTDSEIELQELFSRIVNLAPPPIGVGPELS